MSEFKSVVNVVPLTRVNLKSSQIFTYLVPLRLEGQIRPGQLVQVPFGKRRIYAVTTSFEMPRLSAEIRDLKTIEELIDAIPVLSESSLTLSNWLANYYVTPLGLVIKVMLPPPSKKPQDPHLVGYEKFNPDFVLTEPQRQAVNKITNSLGKPSKFLLHGITGSGKTEVYMQVMERVLESHKQLIILVPEISLTTAAIERFARRFGIEKIALLHSQLSASARYFMWQKIREKEKPIIIGPRSAIFAPVQDLGLIILDEEHDASFKQYDQNPKYHARTVASRLSELWSCPLILGDATPSIETYYEVVSRQAMLLNLPHRIKADVGLPKVQVVDMRQEVARGGFFSIFSEYLKYAILENLKKKRQIILFLNRRGAATFVMCQDCGFVPTCKNCSVNLVWHSFSKSLICHHCGKAYDLPISCPVCQGQRIKYFGIGTQMVEEELRKFLGQEFKDKSLPAVVRMDKDTTTLKDQSSKIYREWVGGKIQILIGTQMISKSWDVSKVGLVGIISADTLLHLPDFRSNERTFQVLTQVAGRAGRGAELGLVILQTYNPDNLAIAAAKSHNYESFYHGELKERQKLGYPPFSQLVKLSVKHQSQEKAQSAALEITKQLRQKRASSFEIIGPVPAFISKLRGSYQFQVILKIPRRENVDLYNFLQDLPNNVDIDVDPESLL